MTNNELIEDWLSVIGENVDDNLIKDHVTSYGNHLWHIFTWGNVPCLEGDEARTAFNSLQYIEGIKFYGGYSKHIDDVSMIGKITAEEIDKDTGSDIYIVAKDFTWTYVRTHESACGPYFCII